MILSNLMGATLVLYSYFLFTVSASLKQHQTLFFVENSDLTQKKTKAKNPQYFILIH